jgi:hypothetical protein
MHKSSLLAATLLLSGISSLALAEESTLKEGAKKVGQETGQVVRKIGEGGKEVGKKVAETAREVGHATRDGAKEFAKAVKCEGETSATPKAQCSSSARHINTRAT